MNPEQLAPSILRLCRRYGIHLRVERREEGQTPRLHAGPRAILERHAYLVQGIHGCKMHLIALLEAEEASGPFS
jgi:hypothetical protein